MLTSGNELADTAKENIIVKTTTNARTFLRFFIILKSSLKIFIVERDVVFAPAASLSSATVPRERINLSLYVIDYSTAFTVRQ